jgi:peptidyl-prolyl cis-trans isomerase SurA
MIKDYKKLIFCFFLITFSFKVLGSEIKILYKINENIITSYDVENESNYLKTLNKNLAKLPKKELMETAIQSLIREKIKKDEIDRVFEINYEQAIYSNNINETLKKIYIGLNLKNPEEFSNYLKNNNINEESLRRKLVQETMWNQLIVNKYNNLIQVDENQIKQKVDELILKNSAVTLYDLSEIVFLEKNKKDTENKYLEIKESIEKIGFDKSAILHSISESSKLGGRIGWINENQISKKIIDAIDMIAVGEYSEIINTAGGNIILKLNDKKEEKTEINIEEEMEKLIRFKKNQLFSEYSIIYYKELENKAYVEKL